LKLFSIALAMSSVCGIDVSIWGNKDCHGNNGKQMTNLDQKQTLYQHIKPLYPLEIPLIKAHIGIRNLYALPMECYKRGDFEIELQINNIGGVKELAIAAAIKDTASASQYVVFFTTDDCNPDNVIDNAWLDDGCSSRLPKVPLDYKSWSVWDMCLTEPGCSLE
jgi:hypothetical protein